MLDVVIAGGGPAGLNAALMLGRARRNVLLCDSGQPRNAGVHAMHGFLSRDGTDPALLRQTARQQLAAYPTVRVRDLAIQTVTGAAEQFTVTLADGTSEQARRLLLATGVADQLPPIPGLAELWGRGVFNCPYCDGWEVRDQPLAVLAGDPRNFQLALQLTRFSPDVLLCSNGQEGLDDDARGLLATHKVALREEPIVRLDGGDGRLERIVFAAGEAEARAAGFLHAATRQRSSLPSEDGRRPGADQRAGGVRHRGHGQAAQHARAGRAGDHRRRRGRHRRGRHRPAIPAATAPRLTKSAQRAG